MLKKSLLSLFLVLLLSIAVGNVSAIRTAKLRRRIHGGRIASMGEFKHQMSGIITAAHCITYGDKNFINPHQKIVVVAGSGELRDKDENIYRDVEWLMIPEAHTMWDQFQWKYNPRHDIAILRLRRPLPLGTDPRLKALKLPEVDDFPEEYQQYAMVSGFGRHAPVSRGSPRLRYVFEEINYPGNNCSAKLVCTKPVHNRRSGICMGDSGSALFARNDDKSNWDLYDYKLIGITSAFHVGDLGCGNGGIYTRVSKYLDFIRDARVLKLDKLHAARTIHESADEMQRLPHCDQELHYDRPSNDFL